MTSVVGSLKQNRDKDLPATLVLAVRGPSGCLSVLLYELDPETGQPTRYLQANRQITLRAAPCTPALSLPYTRHPAPPPAHQVLAGRQPPDNGFSLLLLLL